MTYFISRARAESGVIPSGATFPASPPLDMLFYFTPWNSLFEWNGSRWVNFIAYTGITMYVDGALGTDSPGYGVSAGAGAFRTIQYAIDMLPLTYGGHIGIYVAAGAYTWAPNLAARNAGSYETRIFGAYSEIKAGTLTASYENANNARVGTVATVGLSVTVTVGGGGSTAGIFEGGFVTANGLTRYVANVIDAVTFTVSPAVDWTAGFAWTWNPCGAVEDAAGAFVNDAYNYKLIMSGGYEPNINDPTAANRGAFIRDTFASGNRLLLGRALRLLLGGWTVGSGYKIYNLTTAITLTGQFNNYLDNLQCIGLALSGGIGYGLSTNAPAGLWFCDINGTGGIAIGFSFVYTCQFRNGAFLNGAGFISPGKQPYTGLLYFSYITNHRPAPSMLYGANYGSIDVAYNYIECNSSSYPIQAGGIGGGMISPTWNAIRWISRYQTYAGFALQHGQLLSTATSNIVAGFTTNWGANAATFGFFT